MSVNVVGPDGRVVSGAELFVAVDSGVYGVEDVKFAVDCEGVSAIEEDFCLHADVHSSAVSNMR